MSKVTIDFKHHIQNGVLYFFKSEAETSSFPITMDRLKEKTCKITADKKECT